MNKQKIKTKLRKVKVVIKDNSGKIIAGIAICGAGGLAMYYESKIDSITNDLDSTNDELESLKELCKGKDACFKEVMSDGLRHGSSVAAQYMVDKKINGFGY